SPLESENGTRYRCRLLWGEATNSEIQRLRKRGCRTLRRIGSSEKFLIRRNQSWHEPPYQDSRQQICCARHSIWGRHLSVDCSGAYQPTRRKSDRTLAACVGLDCDLDVGRRLESNSAARTLSAFGDRQRAEPASALHRCVCLHLRAHTFLVSCALPGRLG